MPCPSGYFVLFILFSAMLGISTMTIQADPAKSRTSSPTSGPASLPTSWPTSWSSEWPKTDFSKSSIDLREIMSGGPPKDGIPAIDNPEFTGISKVDFLGDNEPVISLSLGGKHKAYPIQILMFHEIVNDTLSGVPIAVTYCPLCNSSIVFERNYKGKILDFGTTGKLRHSDMVMYDRQSESWWQQFIGEAIIGKYLGAKLKSLPSRIEAFALFKKRHPDGQVLKKPPSDRQDYGRNPYAGYDSAKWPFLYRGDYKGPVPPLSYLVAVGKDAWPLTLLRKKGELSHQGLLIRWQKGQASALDNRATKSGRDIGNVTVTRDGKPVVYSLPFAFAYTAFMPKGVIHIK